MLLVTLNSTRLLLIEVFLTDGLAALLMCDAVWLNQWVLRSTFVASSDHSSICCGTGGEVHLEKYVELKQDGN